MRYGIEYRTASQVHVGYADTELSPSGLASHLKALHDARRVTVRDWRTREPLAIVEDERNG